MTAKFEKQRGNTLLWLCAVLAVGAVAYGTGRHERRGTQAPAPSATLQARQASVAAALAKGPTFRQTEYASGFLVEITIPQPDSVPYLLKQDRCYVWRDAASKSSAIHCPTRDELAPRNFAAPDFAADPD